MDIDIFFWILAHFCKGTDITRVLADYFAFQGHCVFIQSRYTASWVTYILTSHWTLFAKHDFCLMFSQGYLQVFYFFRDYIWGLLLTFNVFLSLFLIMIYQRSALRGMHGFVSWVLDLNSVVGALEGKLVCAEGYG